jgi:hypothetical protein
MRTIVNVGEYEVVRCWELLKFVSQKCLVSIFFKCSAADFGDIGSGAKL